MKCGREGIDIKVYYTYVITGLKFIISLHTVKQFCTQERPIPLT